MTKPLLRLDQVSIAYPQGNRAGFPPWVAQDVSLALMPGERLGLVGESGCGKSTLGRAVMRMLPPGSRVEGKVFVDDCSVLSLSPSELRRWRGEVVALIFQDPMTRLDPLMTIGDHCLETLQAHQPRLPRHQARERAIAVLETVKIPADRWSQYPHEFSGGMRQRVAIALALLLDPKVIIADEPTTSLDVTVAAQILQELTRLCAERQMALVLISHDLALVGEYCDRLAVMYRGQIVEMGPAQTVLEHPQHDYTRSLLAAALQVQGQRQPRAGVTDPMALPLLQIRQLRQHYTLEQNFVAQFLTREKPVIRAVDDVSLDLYAGEILGLVGESGCGKSTLSRTVLQLVRPTAGRVEFLGQDLSQLSQRALRTLRHQMQMIFQDPHACLNPMMTVGQSIQDPLLIHRLATLKAAKAQALTMLEQVGLTPSEEFYHRYPAELSGGQQQRVAIARALITRPKLLICDEPVSMLDASVQVQVLELMLALKQAFNLTYLFITHDLWVAHFLCDRIAVMQGGKIVELGPTETLFNQPQHPYTQSLLGSAPLLSQM